MAIGKNQNVHIANASDQDIYVMVAQSPGWVFADVVVDAALFLAAIGEIKKIVGTAQLPETIKTFSDLYRFLIMSGRLLKGTYTAGSRPTNATLAIVEAFKKESIRIPVQQSKNVREQGLLATFLNASGIAGIANAQTVTLTVMSADGKQVSQFFSGPDQSWIATKRHMIVRSKYGSLWQEDPGTGTEMWDTI